MNPTDTTNAQTQVQPGRLDQLVNAILDRVCTSDRVHPMVRALWPEYGTGVKEAVGEVLNPEAIRNAVHGLLGTKAKASRTPRKARGARASSRRKAK